MNDYPLVGFMLRLMEIIDENNYDIALEHLDFEIVIGDNNNLKYVSINVGEDKVTYPSSEAIEVTDEMQSKADYLAKCLYISGSTFYTFDLVDDYMKYDDDGVAAISYSKDSYNSPVSEDNPNTIADYVDMLYNGDNETRNKVYQDFYIQDKGYDPQLIMLQVLSSNKSFVSVEDFELLINSDIVLYYGESDKDFYVEVTLDDGTYSMWNTEKTNELTAQQLYEAASECYKQLNDSGINIQYDNVDKESIVQAADIMKEYGFSGYVEVYDFCLADGLIISDVGFAAYLNQYLSDNGYTSNMIFNGYTLNLEDFEQFTIVFDSAEEMNADFATGVKMAYVNSNGFEAYYPEKGGFEPYDTPDTDSQVPEDDNLNFSNEEILYNSALLFYIDLDEKGYTVDASEITKEDLTKALLSSADLSKLSETDKNVSAEQFAYLVYKGCLENSFEGGKLYGELDLTKFDDFSIEFGEDEYGNPLVSRVTILVEGDMLYEYPHIYNGQGQTVDD